MFLEMVSEIHAAQKVRDEAMMSRIKLANEERDAALTQTSSLLEKLGLSPRATIDPIPGLSFHDVVISYLYLILNCIDFLYKSKFYY